MSRPELSENTPPAIDALLNYLIDTGDKPASFGGVSSAEADQKRKGKYQEFMMPVYDGRAIAGRLSLDREGFIFVTHETKMKDFFDEAEVRSVYYPETEQLVTQYSGAQRVVVFDHTLRSADSAVRDAKQISGPVRNAHNDYTEWSGPQRVRDLLPEEAEHLLKRRFAVIQTWRPIRNPVEREPLAIADARSIGTKELIPSSRVYPNRVGEVYHCTFNPEHRWYYFPRMQRNEAMVFKCFDSMKDGRARWTAHCAFDDPTSPPDAPPRESIEMRTLAFF
ncbi:MAG TPA: CmcJ/NvfI family oxidoreductase [Candidatus Limnocylindria bacterium]|nr:CmcJ/NvfI family oxidoreductase [Candidatus Limnocylindria bacterium]